MAIELEKRDLRSYELRKRKHKQIVTIITIVSVIAGIGFIIFAANLILHKNYTSYQVIHKTKRSDSSSAKYDSYGTGVLRYSRDGAMAMDGAGNLLWNGTFEMKDPIADVCDKYVVISDRGYKSLEVFNGEGGMTTINVPDPIIKSEIANQGVVAVLMDGDDVNYIKIYSEDGEELVSTRTINEKDGFPIDLSLSNDGRKLVTSYLSISSGKVQNKVTFYNFGGVGQNYVDNVVGGFDYGQTIIPNIEFINNNTVCTFGDDRFSLYSMNQTPKVVYEETFKSEIKSIFHSDKYVGFVLDNGDKEDKYLILLYDLKGNVILDKAINYNYDNIYVSGDEVILYSNLEWTILHNDGEEKFHYTFDSDISYILPVNNIDSYIIIDNQYIEEVKLSEAKK
ncbi:hypothetical protein Ana3638_04975 [Anaerocolumna sedimenticola]|uniref:6-bladed beta-propeller n=1 Tax=Anaerocolumna sedimenticola TaxID=2696063 RepID=A0A6P1TJX2_9FIRM|nr:DUF5711 family protein [Anaerocolumna sedimenticola]QHQ60206.1 hypothetical protein Ana3638_04975 [Anaerocolumna sedimenticola]